MKTRSVAIIALTAVTASGCGIGVHFADYRHTRTLADAHVSGTVTDLQVNAGDGHVVVSPGGGDGVTVHRVVHYQSGTPHPSQRLTNGTLTFSSGCSRCRVDYDLTVPASVRVRVRTDSGRIDVSDVAGADVGSDSGSVTVRRVASGVSARSDSGGIRITDVAAGALRANTDSGSIRASGLATPTVTASSDSGGIHLGFTSAPTDVRASADSGSLHLTVPTGRYDVTVHTDSGSPHVERSVGPERAREDRPAYGLGKRVRATGGVSGSTSGSAGAGRRGSGRGRRRRSGRPWGTAGRAARCRGSRRR